MNEKHDRPARRVESPISPSSPTAPIKETRDVRRKRFIREWELGVNELLRRFP